MNLFIDEGGDPYAAYVKALLHFNGSDGSTTITDETGRTWSAVNGAQIDTAQSVFGGSSLLLDGVGDFLTTPNDAAIRVGGLDHTIECRIRLDELGRLQTIHNKRDASSAEENSFWVSAANLLSYAGYSGGSPVWSVVGATTLTTGVWYAVAASRVGSTCRVFVNGVVDGTDASAGTASANTGVLHIGRDGFNTARDFHGWIDEYRLTIGVGRYSANYTPAAAAPFSLT